MPLTKRSLSPVNVSLNRLPGGLRSGELECVSNGSLANLIRQLSSLSRHAEDLIGELHHEALKVQHKTNTLKARVERLEVKVTQLDSNVEEVSLSDLHLRKAFKSSALIDQHSLSRQSLPTAMGEAYLRCHAPPDLNKLNPYRDAGTEPGLKLYTDPDYFFRLWREEMLKDGPRPRPQPHSHNAPAQQQQQRPNKTKHTRPHQNRGEDFVRQMGQYQAPQDLPHPQYQQEQRREPPPGMIKPEYRVHNGAPPAPLTSQYMSPTPRSLPSASQPLPHATSPPRPSQRPPDPPPPPQTHTNGHLQSSIPPIDLEDSAGDISPDLPPPPPPISLDSLPPASLPAESTRAPPPPPQTHTNGHLQSSIPPIDLEDSGGDISPDLPPPPPPISLDSLPPASLPAESTRAPPPPPPPPPPPTLLNGQARPSLKDEIAARAAQRESSGTSFAGAGSGGGGGGGGGGSGGGGGGGGNSELLSAIRKGITLKKVERQAEKAREKEAISKGDDVAAILRKRMEDVMGTSDDDEEDQEFNDDDEWDE